MNSLTGILMPAIQNLFWLNLIEGSTKQYYKTISSQVVKYDYNLVAKKLTISIEVDSGAIVLNEINKAIDNISKLAVIVDLVDGGSNITGRIMFESLSVDSASFNQDYAQVATVMVDLTLSVGRLSFASPERKIVPLYT